jgi:hypothetical protein
MAELSKSFKEARAMLDAPSGPQPAGEATTPAQDEHPREG